MSSYHIPVLLEESVSALIGDTGGTYADATYGGGGHTSEILSRLTGNGRVIAFDRDSDAIANASSDSRLTLIQSNFRFIHNYIMLLGRGSGINTDNIHGCTDPLPSEGIDGILADLGVSSHQFDTPERGFSFRYDSPLDMRMDNRSGKTAADIVNSYSEEDLEKTLRLYGEVDNSRRIASLICKSRQTGKISTTGELCEAIRPALPGHAEHKALAKIYQALRIEDGAEKSLKPGGRLVVITYHSLEDRMVKNFIKTGNVYGKAEKDIYGNTGATMRAVNRKPIVPEEEEIASNTRARSAKLRIAEKI